MLPVGYSFGIEVSYPVSQPMTNGVMTLIMQICSVFVSLLGEYLCTHYTPLYALAFFIGQFTLGSICSLFVKEDLRRLKNEK